MNIIKASKELSAQEMYNLCMNPEARKLSEVKGSELEIAVWAEFEDVNRKTGELQRVVSLLTTEGEIFGTNSTTFIDELERMTDLFRSMGEEVHAIRVTGGVSKAGREFITCVYVR